MTVPVILNLIAFLGLMFALSRLADKGLSLSQRVLTSLIAGAMFGLALQFIYHENVAAIRVPSFGPP